MAIKKESCPAEPTPPPSSFLQAARRKLPEPEPLLTEAKVNMTQGEIQKAAPSQTTQGRQLALPFEESKLVSWNLMFSEGPMPQLSNNQLKKLADAEFRSGSTVEQLIKKTKEDSTKGADEWEREYAARKEAALVRNNSFSHRLIQCLWSVLSSINIQFVIDGKPKVYIFKDPTSFSNLLFRERWKLVRQASVA